MTAFGAVRHLNCVASHLRANQLVLQSSACNLRLCRSFSSGVQQYWPVPCISCDVVSFIQLLRLCSTGPPHQIPAVHELPSSDSHSLCSCGLLAVPISNAGDMSLTPSCQASTSNSSSKPLHWHPSVPAWRCADFRCDSHLHPLSQVSVQAQPGHSSQHQGVALSPLTTDLASHSSRPQTPHHARRSGHSSQHQVWVCPALNACRSLTHPTSNCQTHVWLIGASVFSLPLWFGPSPVVRSSCGTP